jgi:hypothetical protein
MSYVAEMETIVDDRHYQTPTGKAKEQTMYAVPPSQQGAEKTLSSLSELVDKTAGASATNFFSNKAEVSVSKPTLSKVDYFPCKFNSRLKKNISSGSPRRRWFVRMHG